MVALAELVESDRPLAASTIINTYQQALTLDLALHALELQDVEADWEVIVVDDGSSDRTAEVVAAHAEHSHVPIAYVRHADRGHRWTFSRNQGIRLSRGQILVFLDADMICDRDTVRRHIEIQQASPCLLAGARLWRHIDDIGTGRAPDEALDLLATSTRSSDDECRRHERNENELRRSGLASASPWRAWFGCHASVAALPGVRYDEAMLGWGPCDIELGARLYDAETLPVRYEPSLRAWQIECPGTIYNPFRLTDRQSATAYVRQVCRLAMAHPDDLTARELAIGFDRLVLDPDGLWRVVPRGSGRPAPETFHEALAWFAAERER